MSTSCRAGFCYRCFSKVLMGILFRPVFGWRADDMPELVQFQHIGVDHSRLAGAVHKSAAETVKGVVILCHPLLKFGMSYFFKNKYHEWLSQAGYHVIGFNFKGFGHSSVESVSFSNDVISVAQWSRQRYPELPIHVLAISFGAFQCIHAIATRRAAFASALFDSTPATLTYIFGSGMVGAVMRWISRSRWADATGTTSIFCSLPLPGDLPCLFLYGEKDRYITGAEVEQVRQVCGVNNVRIYPDCGHMEIRKVFPSEYIATVTAFFDAHGRSQVGPNDADARPLSISSRGY